VLQGSEFVLFTYVEEVLESHFIVRLRVFLICYMHKERVCVKEKKRKREKGRGERVKEKSMKKGNEEG
jgi:hypothetical protein